MDKVDVNTRVLAWLILENIGRCSEPNVTILK